MPHLKFHPTTFEPRVISNANFQEQQHLRLLTTKRAQHHSQEHEATPEGPAPHPPTFYPKSILPTASHKRKQKASYCTRLARALDRFHESPSVYNEALRQPPPPLIRLPAELRQHILNQALDNDDVLLPRPNSRTQTLALTCKTFAMDIRAVSKLWDVREHVLRGALGTDREGLSAYMRDLLAPLRNASLVYANQTRLRAGVDARRTERYDRKVRGLKMRKRRGR